MKLRALSMKLIELAEEHNLDQELLQEVCIEDLSIELPKGMDSLVV